MKRWLRRIAILAFVILAIVIARLTLFRPAPVPVTVCRVENGRVEETVVNSRAGTVRSRLRAQMSPGVAGLVAEIPVKKGQTARAGQVLLRIDDREYRNQVALSERSLAATHAAAEEACLTADQAERERTRAEGLGRQGLISDQNLEAARTKAKTAGAGCSAARERVKEAEAALGVARATLAKTAIIAPFSGVVLDITTEVGEWISPSPPGVFIPPVVDLIDPDSLYVEAPLDEADVARVRAGLPVRITMDAFRGRSFPGRLSYISSFVETRQEQSRTLDVEAVFEERDLPPNLLPGLSADIEVILDAKDGILRLPTYALLEGDRALVVRKDRLVEVKVTAGVHNWEYTEIVSGLISGERVVVSLDRPEVKAGARVRITGEIEK